MSSIPVNGAEIIRLRINKFDWSQAQLADAAGVGKRTIERAESEENTPLRPDIIAKIATALGALPEQITLIRDPLREEFAAYLNELRKALSTYVMIDLRTVDEGSREDDDLPQLEQLFVPPYLLRTSPKSEEIPASWDGQTLAIDCLARERHALVIGEAGSGKSTIVNYATLQLAQLYPTVTSRKFSDGLPLQFILRNLRITGTTTFDTLLEELCRQPGNKTLRPDRLKELILAGRTVLIFDGIDEIGREARQALRAIIWEITKTFPNNFVIATSRPAGNAEFPFDHEMIPLEPEAGVIPERVKRGNAKISRVELQRYEQLTLLYLAPFADTQIEEFGRHWYAKRFDSDDIAAQHAVELWKAIQLSRSTLALARIPNILTIMALLHERTGVLPHGKALLYAAIARAYLFAIDQTRRLAQPDGVPRELDEQKRWLGRVAWEIQLRRAVNEFRPQYSDDEWDEEDEDDDQSPPESILEVTTDDIVTWIVDEQRISSLWGSTATDIDAETRQQVEEFIRYVRERAGLLIERSTGRYSFVHLSFVEYFAAFHLVKHVSTLSIPAAAAPPRWGAQSDKPINLTNLSQLAAYEIWHEPLLFTFEQLSELSAVDARQLFQSVFGWFQDAKSKKAKTEEAINARSNQWFLLARLGENRHTKISERCDSIRQGCTDWARRVDPLDRRRCARKNRFIDRWLGEIEESESGRAFVSQFWAAALELVQHTGTKLEIWGYAIGDAGVREIAQRLPNLNELNLEGNEFGDAGAREIAQRLTNLTTLDLRNNEIGDAGAKEIAQRLTNLTTLDLRNNEIGDAGAKEIAQRLPNLTTLYLNGNEIGDAGAREIAQRLTNLTALWLENNPISEVMKTELREQLTGRIPNLYL